MPRLENCIDMPVKRLVALMNLYGLETTWSCCGFNNGEQNKDHVLGLPQIWVKLDNESYNKIIRLLDSEIFGATGEWNIMIRKMGYQQPLGFFHCNYQNRTQQFWNDPSSPHYHERMNVAIRHLEDKLLEFKNEFRDEAIIKDQNTHMRQQMPGWNAKPARDWVVNKEQILRLFK